VAAVIALLISAVSASMPAVAQVVSINIYHTDGTVAGGEKAGIVLVDGWNNVQIPGGNGVVTPSPGFGPVIVNDASGIAAAFIASTLGSHYNGDSGTAATGLGAGLMAEYLGWDSASDGEPPDDSGTLTVSGLGVEYTGPGYEVYVYFDTDTNDSMLTITIDGQVVAGADASTFNGVMVEATGAGGDSNYAVFRGLTASSFTISMDASEGRGAVNGVQIVSADYVAPPVPGPNILLFVVDDMGWQDTSEPFADAPTVWNGIYQTPNMELLADAGMKFTNAYAASPVCSPSRASLLTGRNPARTHITNWLSVVGRSDGNSIVTDPVWTSQGLQPNDGNITLPSILRGEGYLTAHVGKAHFAAESTPGADPVALGFDINVAGSEAGLPGSYFPDYGGLARLPGLEAYWDDGTYLNVALTLEAEKIIDQSIAAGRPFFLNMAHYAVHTPIEGQGDPALIGNYASLPTPEDDYAAMLESMDASLGSLLVHLQNRGIADQTLVIFFSDNGGLSHFIRYDSPIPGDPWHANEHNSPLASGKGAALEGGLRVPMIVSWAGQDPTQPPIQPTIPIAPGTISDAPVHSDDLFETLLRAAEVPNAESYLLETDGVDLAPLLSGQPFARGDALYFHYPHQWVGDVGTGHGIEPFTAMRDGRWKLIYYWSSRNWVLYDLELDLGETTDLAAQETGVVHSLGTRLIDWLQVIGAQMPRDAETFVDEPLPQLPPPDCSNDYDGDGFSVCDGDCDDLSAAVYPGAAEVCDGVDNQCSGDPGFGQVDEGGDGLCADALYCNGVEVCSGTGGCQPGAPVVCDDASSCTGDSCNETTDSCDFTNNSSCAIGGTVYYYRELAGSEPSSKPVPNIDIALTPGPTSDGVGDAVTDGSGSYLFAGEAGTLNIAALTEYSDAPLPVDYANVITAFDAAYIAQYSVGSRVFSSNQIIAADVTNDDVVSALDAARVAQLSARIPGREHFTVATDLGSDWRFVRCDSYPSCGDPFFLHNPLTGSVTDDFYAILYGDVTGNWSAGTYTGGGGGQVARETADFAITPEDEVIKPNGIALRHAAAKWMRAIRRSPRLPAAKLTQTVRRLESGRLEIVLDVKHSDGILGLDLELAYDAARVTIVGLRTIDLASEFSMASNDRDGRLRLGMFSVAPLEGSGSILAIEIEGSGDGRSTPFHIDATANEGQIALRVSGNRDGRPPPRRPRDASTIHRNTTR
jgi:arylsulfatase A-like enzyme